MAQAPERHTPAWKKAAEGIERHGSEPRDRTGKNPYSHRRYRKWRARMKRKQRAKDEQRVHEIYKNLEQRSFWDYINWLQSARYDEATGQEIGDPLCVDCLDEELIKPADVLDHIRPIEKDGEVYDETNLQWLCNHHHQVKRTTDDKS